MCVCVRAHACAGVSGFYQVYGVPSWNVWRRKSKTATRQLRPCDLKLLTNVDQLDVSFWP